MSRGHFAASRCIRNTWRRRNSARLLLSSLSLSLSLSLCERERANEECGNSRGTVPGLPPRRPRLLFGLARSLSSPLSFRSRLTAPAGSATKMPPERRRIPPSRGCHEAAAIAVSRLQRVLLENAPASSRPRVLLSPRGEERCRKSVELSIRDHLRVDG